MLSKTEAGMVIAIWGQAWVRGADGFFRVLKLGDALQKGTVLLTAQDAIVQIGAEGDRTEPDAVAAAATKRASGPTDADQAIEAINKGKADAAPAAGIGGGGDGDLTPGLRVERISEVAPTGALARNAGDPDAIALPALPDGNQAGQTKTNTVTEPTTTIDAVEEGPNVAIGLTAPAGATQIHVDTVPSVGQLLLADGTPVAAGAALTAAQFGGLVYLPPADYLPGTPTGDLHYSTTVGSTNTVGSVGFHVTAVNDAPVATAGGSSGAEDSSIPVALGATDVDSPVAGITITQAPANGALLLADGVTIVGAGQTLTPAQAAGLLYRPDPNTWGTTTIGFVAVDDQGATSAPATWTLTVTAVNDVPVAGADSFTVAEDGSTTINVLANDSDADGDPLAITQVNGTPISDGGPAVTVLHGSVQLVGGQLVFTPAPDYNGPVNFTYTASDGTLASTAAVTGTVSAVPDAPRVGADTFTVAEDASVAIDVRANDSDPDGGTLTITQVNGSAIVDGGTAVAVPGGSVQLLGGQLLFTPAPDFNGPVSFNYTVSNGSLSSTGAVSGSVTPVEDAPQASLPGAQSGSEDSALVFSGGNGNALTVGDVDGDALSVTVAVTQGSFTLASTAGVAVSGNGSGAVTLSGSAAAINAALNGAFYTPDADYNGPASLTLQVSDGVASSAGSVPITVTPVADIADDAVTTNEDTAVAINVLANDSFEGGGPVVVAVDGHAISAGGAAVAVANGTVALNALGQLVFTPALNYNNTPATPTTFTYTVSSGGVTETASVAVEVTPVPDVATVSLAASPSVAEGGSIVYTATLTSAAFSAVDVVLSNGAIIAIAAGGTSGSVAVAAPGDDVYLDAGAVSNAIASATGGGFDVLNVDATPAVTAITDTIDTTTVSLTATPTVAEGGSITYTATLNAAAQTPVTVTLSNGAVIAIAAGASSGSVSVAAPGDDAIVDAGPVSATIASASGGNFEHLAVDPTPATTAVSDTIDTTTVSLTATPSVAEGGSIVYSASLSSVAQTPVTVTLSNGAVIAIAAGASSGSVSIAAPGDDVYLDAGSVSATISTASGGNFEALAINPAPATTAVTDTVDATTVSLTASPTVAEGGSIVYTASLSAAAQSPVSVTLSNGAVITIAAGASSGQVSVAAPGDDVYVDAGSVSASISAASGGNFESLVVNPATASTAITDTIDTSTVSLTATPTVAEGGSIVYTASLTSLAQTAVTVTLSTGAVITIAAGRSSGSVAVAAPGDDVYLDAGNVSATIANATGGNFEALAINPAAATTAVTDTIDTTTVSLTATPSVAEGGSIVYTASLTSVATSAVTVTLDNGATITIAAGASVGTASVNAPADDVYVDAGSVAAHIGAVSGGGFENLAIDATPAVTAVTDTIDATTVSITGAASVAEGASAGYTVSLTSVAQSPVTITLAYGGTAVDGSDYTGVTTVTIPAGASSANFSVATIDDALAEGAENFTVSLVSATGGNFEQLAISGSANAVGTTIVDDDTAKIAVSDTTAIEGGYAVFAVTLSTASTTPITFTPTLASGTATVGSDTGTTLETFNGVAWVPVTGAGITFAPGITTTLVRVATIDDPIADSGETFTLTATVTAGVTGNVSATGIATIDDEVPGDVTTVSLAASPAVAEGGSIVYTATLTNAASSPVTVQLSNGATIVIASGATSGSIGVAAPGDDPYLDAGSVSVTISNASGGGFESLTVDATPAVTAVSDTIDDTTVSLTATPTVAEGGSIVYTALLTSAAQTPVTVNLSNGASIVIAAGQSTGSVTVAAPADDAIVDAGTVSAAITTASGGNFEHLTVDTTAALTGVSDTIDTTTVSLSATASVAEGGVITYTASLDNPAGTAVTVTLSNGATIVIAAGASSASVNVAAPADNVYVDAGSESATISNASGGNFESLAINPAPAVTSVTDTIDTTTVSLSASPSVAEGGSITYTAALTAPAQSDVTVTLASGHTITIVTGASSGSISVAAPADDPYLDAGSVAN
ncbi:MAG TPA: immunoglobulin-like domain-containing protein, partial [Burkholderiaceae bacterium]|nr:immunoglobulin-like domain-containing protein [Burkholderiaceae bacterium]